MPSTGVRRNWFITGASRGLGRAFTKAALDGGNTVVATARHPEELAQSLAHYGQRALVKQLDVRERAQCIAALAEASAAVGPIDVLVNNAGYGLTGAIEEVTEAQAREEFDTNFFGTLWLSQAVLPEMRGQGHGHIIQISSLAGLISLPNMGMYSASKWALEAMGEALAQEVESFGIKLTLVEPGGFRTGWRVSGVKAQPAPAYNDTVVGRFRQWHAATAAGQEPGDPERAAQLLLELVEQKDPPLRLLLGSQAFDLTIGATEDRLAKWRAAEATSRSVDYDDAIAGLP